MIWIGMLMLVIVISFIVIMIRMFENVLLSVFSVWLRLVDDVRFIVVWFVFYSI